MLPDLADHPSLEPLTIVVQVAGPDLDLATAPLLEVQLHRLVTQHPLAEIVVDLSGVTFMDCAGLRPLLRARRLMGDRLTLRCLQPRVVRLLDLTGLHDTFRIRPFAGLPSSPSIPDPGTAHRPPRQAGRL